MTKSLLSLLDKSQTQNPLTGHQKSLFSFIGTLCYVSLSIVIFVIWLKQYNLSEHYVQFLTYQSSSSQFLLNQDLKIAIIFKDKITNTILNHNEVQNSLKSRIRFHKNQSQIEQAKLQKCKSNYFSNTINPIILSDCLLIQSTSKFNIRNEAEFKPFIDIIFDVNCDGIFKCSHGSQSYMILKNYLSNFFQQNYYELYLTSTVVINGEKRFQLHKFVSTNFQNQQFLAGNIQIYFEQSQYIYKKDIFSSRSERNINTLRWKGLAKTVQQTKKLLPKTQLYANITTHGQKNRMANSHLFENKIVFSQNLNKIYVFHKSFDLFVAVLAGSIFILYLLFSILCSYLNSQLAKCQNFKQLYLQSAQNLQIQKDLKLANISFWDCLKIFLCINSQYTKKFSCITKTLDIIKIIKNIKLAQRNLQINNIQCEFRKRQLSAKQKLNSQNYSQKQGSNAYSAKKVCNLKKQQLESIKTSEFVSNLYAQNLTVQVIRNNQKGQTNKAIIAQLLEENNFNRFFQQKKTYNSTLRQVKSKICSILKHLDFFGVNPTFKAEPQNYSCFGFLIVLIILILVILTLIATFRIADDIKYNILEDLDNPLKSEFILNKGQNFKFAVCFHTVDPLFYLDGPNKISQLIFYSSKDNKITILNSEKMKASQMTYFGYFPDQLQNFDTFNCFRVSDNQQIIINANKLSQAYFGFKFIPYCSTAPICNVTDLNNRFSTFINKYQILLLVPQIRYNPTSQTLQTGVFQKVISSKNMVTIHKALQKTFYVDGVELYDIHSPKARQDGLLQKTLSFSQFLDKKQVKTISLNSTQQTFYDVKIKYSVQKQQIYSKSVIVLQIIGTIGGVILFWTGILCCFARQYNNFKYQQKLNEQLFVQKKKTNFALKFIQNYLPIGCLLANNKQLQVSRININKILNNVNLYKKSDILAQLSCALFQNPQQRKLSRICFKRSLALNSQLKVIQTEQNLNLRYQDNINEDSIVSKNFKKKGHKQDNHKSALSGQLQNSYRPLGPRKRKLMNSMGQSFQNDAYNEESQNQLNCMPAKQRIKHQLQTQFVQYEQTTFIHLLHKLDIFYSDPQLSIDGKSKVKSIFGGICTIFFIVLLILLIVYFSILPTQKQNYEISKFRYLDNPSFVPHMSKFPYQQGIILRSGYNFKLGLSFYQKANDQILDVSSQTSNIGISIYQIHLVKQGSTYQTHQYQIPLQKCENGYFDDSMNIQDIKEQFQNISNAFCIPNNKVLSLKGTSGQNQLNFIKLSIFDKSVNSTAQADLNNFLEKYLVKYHISSPIKKSFYNPQLYETISFSLSQEPQSFPVQRNITFLKYLFENNAENQLNSAYSYNVFRQYQRLPQIDIYSQHRNDLFFYYSDIVQHTYISFYSNIQIFGLFGGCLFLLIYIFMSIVSSFNHYKMTYVIGQKLYIFQDDDKKGSNSSVQKQRKYYFSEFQLFKCWMLLPIAYFLNNVQFNQNLKKVSVIQKIVQSDLNIFILYQKIFAVKQALNHLMQIKDFPKIKLANIYIKKVYNARQFQYDNQFIKKSAEKHQLSAYQQYIMCKCLRKQIQNHQEPFQDQEIIKKLQKAKKNYHFNQIGPDNKGCGKNIQTKNQFDQQKYSINLILSHENVMVQDRQKQAQLFDFDNEKGVN